MKRASRLLLVACLLFGTLALCAPSSEAGIFRRGGRYRGYGGVRVYRPGWGFGGYRSYGYGYGTGYPGYGTGYWGYGMGYPGMYGTSMAVGGVPIGGFSGGAPIGGFSGGAPIGGFSGGAPIGGFSRPGGVPIGGFSVNGYPY
jgi:hypothetical protein